MRIIRILIQNGADPNIKNKGGKTPLDTAISKEKVAKYIKIYATTFNI